MSTRSCWRGLLHIVGLNERFNPFCHAGIHVILPPKITKALLQTYRACKRYNTIQDLDMTENSAWPPSTGLTSKIIPRKDAILQLSYSTIVHAPASLVFATILRVADYGKWNTWIPSARILQHETLSEPGVDPNDFSSMRIGSAMEFEVVMNAEKPTNITKTPLKVVDICTPSAPTSCIPPDMLADASFTEDLSRVYRVSWTGNGGMYVRGMKVERFHEVIVRSDEECEVRTWEIMGGILSRLVKLMYKGTLDGKVALWCEDLKKYCEKLHADGKTS